MSPRSVCLLNNVKLTEAIGNLLEILELNQIQDSLRACVNCECGLDRNTMVNMHGQLQSLHYILSHLQGDIEDIHENQQAQKLKPLCEKALP